MAGVKVLVRIACVVVASVAIGVSAWQSGSITSKWGPWVGEGDPALYLRLEQSSPHLEKMRSMFGREFFGGTIDRDLAAVVGVIVLLVLMISALAAFSALRARYPRRVLVVGALFLLFAFWMSNASDSLSQTSIRTISRLAATTVSLCTVYLLWNGLTERALTIRYVCYALVPSVAFMVIDLDPPSHLDAILGSLFLPLMICVLAPWSLHRVRHM
jgi:hypothetical protein